ncbi:unnamed protein product [Linum tenue]|uniref:Uncharacterized protein n=1 Tax=Linum tenue TaxID=586396 RepID=A0AAV0P649_9ROSI|nr:unnamed protein product [Linum tenue]
MQTLNCKSMIHLCTCYSFPHNFLGLFQSRSTAESSSSSNIRRVTAIVIDMEFCIDPYLSISSSLI